MARHDSPQLIGGQALALAQIRSRIKQYAQALVAAEIALQHFALIGRTETNHTMVLICQPSSRVLALEAMLELNQRDKVEESLVQLRSEIQQWKRFKPDDPAATLALIEERLLTARSVRQSADYGRLIQESEAMWKSLQQSHQQLTIEPQRLQDVYQKIATARCDYALLGGRD